MDRVIDFDHPLASDAAVTGGKGANLALAARDLPVPPGIVVISAAYREFLKPLRADIACDLAKHAVEDASARIRTRILDTELPLVLVEAIAAGLLEESLDEVPLAVRSSGTMEDLPGAAFAGQHDTILGVRGHAAVCDAVRRCYASLWNAHAIQYRARLGLDHLQASMAVVIQLLVQVEADESAGVAFSVDPVRGAVDTVLINAAWGLGETVVAGDAPVDEYRVSRKDWSLHDRTVANKPHALVADESGTREVTVAASLADAPALTDDQLRAVAELAVAAENHFNFPQDIEWAWRDGTLYLLQSRPVTRFAAKWTRDESAERFPNAVTPLTWDLVEEGFHTSLNHSFALMGLPHFGDKWFAVRDYYVYGNQAAVEVYGGRTPTSLLRDLDSIRDALPQIARQFAWIQELPVNWMRDLDTYLLAIGSLMREPLDGRPLSELWDYVLRVNDIGKDYFLPNIAISLTQRTLYVGLLRILALAVGPEQAQVTFDRLLASTDTKTGQVNAELWVLSRIIRGHDDLAALVRDNDSRTALSQLDAHPEFKASFDRFLRRHGHRELDFDAYHPTWLEAPHALLSQLALMADQPDEDRAAHERQQKITMAETEYALLARVPEQLRYLIQEVIRLARAYTALDDLEHYQTTRLTLPFRRGLRAIGERLLDDGLVNEPMDVFFCPYKVLDAAIRSGELAPIKAAVVQHKAGYLQACTRTPDWVFGEQAAADDDGDALTGLAGSPGSVEGEVFVVRNTEDFPDFPRDAILVARTTNPAWTPLFYRATGVITESGGPLSHGAVTARELGLPAVMSVRDATRKLVNGQRVRIDGAAGRVVIL